MKNWSFKFGYRTRLIWSWRWRVCDMAHDAALSTTSPLRCTLAKLLVLIMNDEHSWTPHLPSRYISQPCTHIHRWTMAIEMLSPVYQKPVPLPFPLIMTQASSTGYNILWVGTAKCTNTGLTWQVVFVLMLLATAFYVVLALRVKKELRLFHYITAMVSLLVFHNRGIHS